MSKTIKFSYDAAENNIKDIREISEEIAKLTEQLVNETESLTEWKGKDNEAFVENVKGKVSFLKKFSERINLRANQLSDAVNTKKEFEKRKATEATKVGLAG